MASGATTVAGIATDASTMTTTIAAGMVTVTAAATGGARHERLDVGQGLQCVVGVPLLGAGAEARAHDAEPQGLGPVLRGSVVRLAAGVATAAVEGQVDPVEHRAIVGNPGPEVDVR
jgi:hypothetical protein